MRGVKREVDWTQYDALMGQYGSRRKVAEVMGLSESTLRSAEKHRGAMIPATASQGDMTVQDITPAELSIAERSALAAYERTIEAGLKTFIEVGAAFLEIRDRRLYRQEFPTFEAYCEQRWGFVRQQAYRLMDASMVVSHLREMSPIGDKLPANEAQARPLAALPPAEQVEVWREAVETAPATGITAAHVAQTVNARAQRTAPVEPAREVSPIGDKVREQDATTRPRPAEPKAPQSYEYITGLPMSDAEADRRKEKTSQEIREMLMDVLDVIPDHFLEDAWHELSDLVNLEESWAAQINALFDRPERLEEWGIIDEDAWDDDDGAECPDDMSPRAWQAQRDQAAEVRRAEIAAAHRDGSCDPDKCPFSHDY